MSFKNNWLRVPSHLRPALARYLVAGIKPGGFLQAVIRNDLKAAVLAADAYSFVALREIITFLINDVPAAAHGTPEIVEIWCLARRAAPSSPFLYAEHEEFQELVRADAMLESAQ